MTVLIKVRQNYMITKCKKYFPSVCTFKCDNTRVIQKVRFVRFVKFMQLMRRSWFVLLFSEQHKNLHNCEQNRQSSLMTDDIVV